MKSYSAGGIVKNSNGRFLIVEQDPGIWSIPKGHIENNENKEQAARREILEETEIKNLKLIKYLGKVRRRAIDNPDDLKHIYVFLFETDDDLCESENNNIKVKWVTFNEMLRFISFKEDKKFFMEIKTEIQKP